MSRAVMPPRALPAGLEGFQGQLIKMGIHMEFLECKTFTPKVKVQNFHPKRGAPCPAAEYR